MNSTSSCNGNKYHLLVTERRSQHFKEWTGDLSLLMQEDGEIMLEINFIDQPDACGCQKEPDNTSMTEFHVECVRY